MPEIVMPKLSDTMTEGTLVAWRKAVGDQVVAGEVLAEIETDKATMEWEAVDGGTLVQILVPEGGKVNVGEPLAFLQAPGEAAPAPRPSRGKRAAQPAAAAAAAAAPAAPDQAEPATSAPPDKTPKAPAARPATAKPPPKRPVPAPPAAAGPPAPEPAAAEGRLKASPLARKLAAEHGISLTTITGTGPGGRITGDDVLAGGGGGGAPAQPAPTLPRKPAAAPDAISRPPPAVAAVPPAPPAVGDRTIPLTGMRRVIAGRLLASKTQIPHFYITAELDVAELVKLRAGINAAAERAGHPKFTVNDFVLKAAAAAAARVPQANASFADDAIIVYGAVHLAVAVAVDDGLVTPVIRDAQVKSLREISDAVRDLAARARSKRLKPEEYQGGTLTVSNLGAHGVEAFLAIINPPQALIVAVGAITKKPVVNPRDEIVVGQRMTIGLSCDHRVVDGAVGAQYLAALKALLENPALMLL